MNENLNQYENRNAEKIAAASTMTVSNGSNISILEDLLFNFYRIFLLKIIFLSLRENIKAKHCFLYFLKTNRLEIIFQKYKNTSILKASPKADCIVWKILKNGLDGCELISYH